MYYWGVHCTLCSMYIYCAKFINFTKTLTLLFFHIGNGVYYQNRIICLQNSNLKFPAPQQVGLIPNADFESELLNVLDF